MLPLSQPVTDNMPRPVTVRIKPEIDSFIKARSRGVRGGYSAIVNDALYGWMIKKQGLRGLNSGEDKEKSIEK